MGIDYNAYSTAVSAGNTNYLLQEQIVETKELNASIAKLSEAITTYNKESVNSTNKMIILTYVIAALTFLMLVGLVVQITLAIISQ